MKRIRLLVLLLVTGRLCAMQPGSQVPAQESFPAAVEPEICVICRDVDLNGIEERNIFSAPCGHRFCRSCIRGWQKHADSCPICRGPLEKEVLFAIVIIVDSAEIKRDLLRMLTIGLGALVTYWAITSPPGSDI